MASFAGTVNLLTYLRTKSQVDCDSLDVPLAKELGPFVDSTSNQADAYLELLLPHRADLLKESQALAHQLQGDFPGVSFTELAVEIAMVNLSLAIAPFVTEAIHVMTNPTLTTTSRIVENAQRITALTSHISPTFPLSRLCIKVVATWEGLQACRILSSLGINTLATTLFTIEQAILAAECGCMYVAPFVHELKAFFDASYDDGGANLLLCLEAQKYYKRYKYSTKVKAAGLLSIEEAETLAGVASMTVAPDLLRTLSTAEAVEQDINALSLFKKEIEADENTPARMVFLESEEDWRKAFMKAYDGKGQWKTNEAIGIFREYQAKAEELMRDTERKS